MCISYGKSEIPEVQLIHFFCWVTFWSFPLNHHLVFIVIGSPNPQFWLSGRFQHHWGGTWSPGFQSRSKGGPHVNELQDGDPQAIINRLKTCLFGIHGTIAYLPTFTMTGWWLNQHIWKNMLVKLGSSSPIFRGENKSIFETISIFLNHFSDGYTRAKRAIFETTTNWSESNLHVDWPSNSILWAGKINTLPMSMSCLRCDATKNPKDAIVSLLLVGN